MSTITQAPASHFSSAAVACLGIADHLSHVRPRPAVSISSILRRPPSRCRCRTRSDHLSALDSAWSSPAASGPGSADLGLTGGDPTATPVPIKRRQDDHVDDRDGQGLGAGSPTAALKPHHGSSR